MNAAGQVVALWQSNGQDGSSWGVYGQRYRVETAPAYRYSYDAAGNLLTVTDPLFHTTAYGDDVPLRRPLSAD